MSHCCSSHWQTEGTGYGSQAFLRRVFFWYIRKPAAHVQAASRRAHSQYLQRHHRVHSASVRVWMCGRLPIRSHSHFPPSQFHGVHNGPTAVSVLHRYSSPVEPACPRHTSDQISRPLIAGGHGRPPDSLTRPRAAAALGDGVDCSPVPGGGGSGGPNSG